MKYLLTLSLVTILLSPAKSATLLTYTSSESPTNSTISASSVDPIISAQTLRTGGGLTPNSGTTWTWRGFDIGNTSYANALSTGDTFLWGFTVTAANTRIDLTQMSLRLDRSPTGPDDFEIRATIDGGSPVSLLSHDYADSGNAVNFNSLDLSSLGPITTNSSIIFTLGAFNAESISGTFDLENQSGIGISIDGTVQAVPEAYSLSFLFPSLLLVSRRKR